MKRDQDKIKFGNIELDADEFAQKNQKHRVTTFIDGDVIEWLKREAEKRNIGYQTLLNMRLRELMDISTDESLIETLKETKIPDSLREAVLKFIIRISEGLQRESQNIKKSLEEELKEEIKVGLEAGFSKLKKRRA